MWHPVWLHPLLWRVSAFWFTEKQSYYDNFGYRHEYPWLCSLRKSNRHICGVTLISIYPKPTVIVGAAHCYNPNSSSHILTFRVLVKWLLPDFCIYYVFSDPARLYKIVCGEHDLRTDENAQIILDVTSIVRHPKYVRYGCVAAKIPKNINSIGLS